MNTLSYLVGIDGGGTGTRARLTAADGHLLGVGGAGPSALGQGVAQAWRHIVDAAADAFRAAGRVHEALAMTSDPAWRARCGLGLGLSGAENPAWVRDFRAAAPARGWGHLALDTDGYAAVLGAHAGRPGALVAIGTGSVGEALHADGRRLTVGGWGWLLGDEAGGAWFGQHAMRIAQQAIDARAPAGALAHAIWADCGADRPTLLDWCASADQRRYAELAPRVFELEARDPAAAALIAAALDAVRAIADALDPRAELPLAITGGIGRQLLPRLAHVMSHSIVDPAGDATEGALRLLQHALQAGHGAPARTIHREPT
jgi:glucosamine kinase